MLPRVQKFDSNGTFLTRWFVGINQFSSPTGVAVDSTGNVHVVDFIDNVVWTFDGNGNLLNIWGGSFGTGDGQFIQPTAVAVDSTGNVYVADRDNHRIQKFGLPALTLTKAVNNPELMPGQLMTYTLTIENKGLISATNALISDTLPMSTTFAGPVSLDPPQASAILATSALDLPMLASNVTIMPQTSITITLPVTINPDVTTNTLIFNTAAVTSAEISTPATGSAIAGGHPIYLPIMFKNQ